ncbi:MAG: hypothetical protein M3P18_21525 [Actinomycetota bacterium]|nr:hypothetical protein [Actinomycetota bacterium]
MLDTPLVLGMFAMVNAVPYLLLAGFVGFASWRWVRGRGKGMLFAADMLAIFALLFPLGGYVVIFSVTTDGGSALEFWWPGLVALALAVIAASFASGVPPPRQAVA